jgi:hypothetical protein
MIRDIYSEITKLCAVREHTSVPLIKKPPWYSLSNETFSMEESLLCCIYAHL